MTKEFPCRQCGATLAYEPGTRMIKCHYCGFENPIAEAADAPPIAEQDFRATLATLANDAPLTEARTVKCQTCAAEFTWDPAVSAADCPFCGSPIVADPGLSRHIQPAALIPFQLTQKEAQERLKQWLGGLWFAPNDVKRYAYTEGKLVGMYVPFWTYDSQTYSDYTGARGIIYTESYTDYDRDGNPVTQTRSRIDWTPVSGNVDRFFDDVLVVASKSLPKKYADRLDEWNLDALQAYQDQYIAGYRSEVYQVGLEEGFGEARGKMDAVIRDDVRADIGGDEQRIDWVNTRFEDITFKHILLPIWMNAYRYAGKSYQFLINAQTGEVEGARPWSWIKIGLAVVAAAIVIGAIAYFASQGK